jgi:dipeptidyl aminopeptidase/acylaminoacyl peptidase
MRTLPLWFVCMSLACAMAAPAPDLPPLIPRQVLFGNPEKTHGRISPNGEWLAYVAPVNGVPNIHLARTAAPDAMKVLTEDRARGIREFVFAFDNRHVLYLQDREGDENFQLFATDLITGVSRALTPKGARAEIDNLSASLPGEVLVNLNDRDSSYFDPVRIEIATGAMRRLVENHQFSAFVSDESFALRIASRATPDGGKEWLVPEGAGWKSWSKVPQEDRITTGLKTFATDGTTLYLVDSRGRNTAALFAVNIKTGERTLIHEDPRADVAEALAHPVSGVLQAVVTNYLRPEWHVLDAAIAEDFAALRKLAGDGHFDIDARTAEDRIWIVRVSSTRAADKTYLYNRSTRVATLWFDSGLRLAGLPLRTLHAVEIRSRDGLILPSYYTLPANGDRDGDGVPEIAVPLVLFVHGGPWDRDSYRFSAMHQYWANRGYAVMSVNFRGSTGFGKSFVNAGDLQWGRKMQDDLLDAVGWAVKRGIAQPDRVAIAGGSYGGYAALAGITMTPKAYACAISGFGPSNLATLIVTMPAYLGPSRKAFTARVGDPETVEGRALLAERSPLHFVQQIERPLLIGHGANDPRVKQAESDQIVKAMQARGIPVTYVLFPDEGHGFLRAENEIAFSAVTEEFLSRCLGGRFEPVNDNFSGSSITVPAGAPLLPGIDAALRKRR